MKIILLGDVRGLGRKDDIKNVSEGYARNFLIPNGLAKPATQPSIEKLESQKEGEKKEISRVENILQEIHKTTKNQPVKVLIRVGSRGEIFAALRDVEILDALKTTHPELGDLKIKISSEKSIKETGVHEVEIDVGRGIKNTFQIEVLPDTVGN
ncbi:MAG: 50S ribosomal protein L9 [Candidatus Colwellbacteria bacterium CG10_big_fil_rev_8_21_14_0_10_42_22]|uniref:Large ribosomal subunit protein bL9 n=1 Tax=Candidatus Colwellbacteria bacterium CG10_big_fil_rev_8_21_14_0_10_42_22 TaxID=1974540 RepID=A0A2H0VG87_9BACT|nr:MAG: 50S ribosomal protein L9 [Candidatus Colwellbacteria bacterium CG10_big_fil_rev_8_21_14_0_10_42_22]